MALITQLVSIVLVLAVLGLPAATLVVYLFRKQRHVLAVLPALWLGAVVQIALGWFFIGVLGSSPPFSRFALQTAAADTAFSGGEVGTLIFGAVGFVLLKAVSLRSDGGTLSTVRSAVDTGDAVQLLFVLGAVVVMITTTSVVVQAVAIAVLVLFLAVRFEVVGSIERDLGLDKLGAMVNGPGPGYYSYTCENCDHTIVDWTQDPMFDDVLHCPDCAHRLEDQAAARDIAHEYYEELEDEEGGKSGLF